MIRHKKLRVLKETEPHIPVPQQLLIALSTLLLVFGTTYINQIIAFVAPEKEGSAPAPEMLRPVTEEIEEVDPFEGVEVRARSAYVWDVEGQRALFNKNADEQWPLASVTKLMTALVAYELMESDSVVDITIDAIAQDGDSGFRDGEHFSLRDITDLMLITSSNDSAYALAAATGQLLTDEGDAARTFVEAMNIKAEEIGLSETYFRNPTGLDISEHEAGAYGSARDVAFLMEYIITNYPDIVELTKANEQQIQNRAGEAYIAENTNAATQAIPNLIASKTGYTDLAGGNLVIAFNAGLNRPVIVSVLGSTFNERFLDATALVRRAQEYLSMQE